LGTAAFIAIGAFSCSYLGARRSSAVEWSFCATAVAIVIGALVSFVGVRRCGCAAST
jgi:ABC-type branched-subunit amino acid transport system permease subunit